MSKTKTFFGKLLRLSMAGLMAFTAVVGSYQDTAQAQAVPTEAQLRDMLEPHRQRMLETNFQLGNYCSRNILHHGVENMLEEGLLPTDEFIANACQQCASDACLTMLPDELIAASPTLPQALQTIIVDFLEGTCISWARATCEENLAYALNDITETEPAPDAAPDQTLLSLVDNAIAPVRDASPGQAVVIVGVATAPYWGPAVVAALRPVAVPIIKYVGLPVAIAAVLIVGATTAASYLDGSFRADGVSTADKVGEANAGMSFVDGAYALARHC